MENQISSLNRGIESERNETAELRGSLQPEIARRQQAERDLTLIVQRTGSETRVGVAEDIRKSPIKVDVVAAKAETPLQSEDVRIIPSTVRSSHTDAPYAIELVIQANVPIMNLRRLLTLSHPVKYLEWRPSSGQIIFMAGEKNAIWKLEGDATKVVIALEGANGLPVLNPEQTLLVFLSADNGPLSIKSIQVGPR